MSRRILGSVTHGVELPVSERASCSISGYQKGRCCGSVNVRLFGGMLGLATAGKCGQDRLGH
jgi:hypothetical protein